MNIVCLGDSICYGFGVAPGKGWTALMAETLKREYGVNLHNAGVNGERAQDGLARLPALLGRKPQLLYVQFGLNDAWQHVSDEEFGNHMTAIAGLVQRAGVPLVMGTNHPVLVDEHDELYGGAYYRDRVISLNSVIRSVAESGKIRLVDIGKLWHEGGSHAMMLLDDGVHLNEAGNARYVRDLYPVFCEYCSAIQG